VDINTPFSYLFTDENWPTKFVIGGVVNLVPIANLAATGYQVRIIRNVAAGHRQPLPEWTDFGDLFLKGLLVAVATIIYGIPLAFLAALSVVSALLGGASAAGSSGEALGAILVVLALGAAGLAISYGLLLALWLPGAILNYALAGDFAAFFRFGEIWDTISLNLGDYVLALAIAWLAALVAGLVGGMVLFVGAAFTSFWAMLVYAHLFGQVGRRRQKPDSI
jgi:hypothetical protein